MVNSNLIVRTILSDLCIQDPKSRIIALLAYAEDQGLFKLNSTDLRARRQLFARLTDELLVSNNLKLHQDIQPLFSLLLEQHMLTILVTLEHLYGPLHLNDKKPSEEIYKYHMSNASSPLCFKDVYQSEQGYSVPHFLERTIESFIAAGLSFNRAATVINFLESFKYSELENILKTELRDVIYKFLGRNNTDKTKFIKFLQKYNFTILYPTEEAPTLMEALNLVESNLSDSILGSKEPLSNTAKIQFLKYVTLSDYSRFKVCFKQVKEIWSLFTSGQGSWARTSKILVRMISELQFSDASGMLYIIEALAKSAPVELQILHSALHITEDFFTNSTAAEIEQLLLLFSPDVTRFPELVDCKYLLARVVDELDWLNEDFFHLLYLNVLDHSAIQKLSSNYSLKEVLKRMEAC